jgi:hypothetical protein
MNAGFSSDRGIHALNVSIVFTTIATVAVLARLYTRIWIIQRTGLDDLAILNALVSNHLPEHEGNENLLTCDRYLPGLSLPFLYMVSSLTIP